MTGSMEWMCAAVMLLISPEGGFGATSLGMPLAQDLPADPEHPTYTVFYQTGVS